MDTQKLSPDCLFCKIIRGEIPSDIVYENDHVIAFNDISPQAPIHILIIPKTHVPDITAIEESNSSIITEMIAAANAIAKKLSLDSGFRLVMNCGKDAGQTVFHLHMHLLAGRPLEVHFGAEK